MGIYFWLLLIPLVGIVSPIYLSFDETIKPIDKVLLFLLLPITETLFIIFTIVESINNTNLIDTWPIQLILLLIILGLSLTLITTLVEGIKRTVKRYIRLTALSIFGLIVIWGIVF